MKTFSLCDTPDKALPTEVHSSDGGSYPIDPCFRTVLGCLRVIADPDMPPLDKGLYVSRRFFLNHPPPDLWEAFRLFAFGESSDGETDEPMMDFEVDAGAIYSSFRQQYGIDLLRADLHWVEFMTLLEGLGTNTAFAERIQVRQTKTEDVAEKYRNQFRAQKERLAIRPKISKREAELQAELDRRLAAGEDPADVLEQLRKEG